MQSLDILRQRSREARLTAGCARFEEITKLPPASLIHASLSLPFCHPSHFSTLWDALLEALLPGGCFCGDLFGINDGWSQNPRLTFHSREAVETLMASFARSEIKEKEEEGRTVVGKEKHWHLFSLVGWKGK